MALNTNGQNLMLNALRTSSTHLALRNASGTEISGGSPAYARQSATWGAASSGSLSLSNTPTFNVPAGVTIKYVSLQSAATGGTEYARVEITNETFSNAGKFSVNSLSISLT